MAYGAGLATGLLHFGGPVCVSAMLGLAILRRHTTAALLTGALSLGAAGGLLALRSDAVSCRARLPAARIELPVRLMDPPGGGMVRVRPIAPCRGHVDARWPAGRADPAGTVAVVTGRWIPRRGTGGRAGGVLVVQAVRDAVAHPTVSERLRSGITGASRRLYGARAPLVDALVLGTRGGLDPRIRDDFARSGLVHLLSISGFHVGLIAAWVVLATRAIGVPRVRALAIGAVVGVAYVAFLSFPAPATRAAALTTVMAVQFARQRVVQADALLACTCLAVLLVEPWAIFDLGGWLSAAALWGATAATRWSDTALGDGFLTRTLASSVGATLATAPFTAAALGTVAMAGIALNIAAIPLAALAVPGVLASLLAAPLSETLAAALAGGAGLLLHAMELLAEAGAQAPLGHVMLEPGLRAATPWVAMLAAAAWTIGRRNTMREAGRRAALFGCVWAWLSLGSALRPSGNAAGLLTLHFLDVGQGDAAAVRTPAGRWIVVDAGPRTPSFDAGRRLVGPFLARRGVRGLAAIVISHAHLDHLGGAEAVLDRFRTAAVLDPAADVPDPAYTSFLDAVAASGTEWLPARAGTKFSMDGVAFEVLHPDTAWAGWGADVNEDSAVLRVTYRAFTAILAGDAGFPAEARLRGRAGTADVLKVGHHGSAGSTSAAWLAELGPRLAVISVGRNRYGHPAPDVIDRLRRAGADVWRTDVEGDVSITTDGITMTARGRRGSVSLSVE